MKGNRHRRNGERGSLLLVVVFIATSIAGLAALISGRVVSEMKQQEVLEQETRAFNGAYAQINLAMNVVNTSAYNEKNQNLALRNAIDGGNGGTVDAAALIERKGSSVGATKTELTGDEIVYTYDADGKPTKKGAYKPGGIDSGYKTAIDSATTTETRSRESSIKTEINKEWMDDENDPLYGLVEGTNVRVYRGREYLKRLQRLKGETVSDADPFGDSDSYFVLEAAGRSGDTIRLVAALVRENEPFSSFVFFQNRAMLGVSGSPRGLVHTNKNLGFYFPNGNYLDTVSAVEGFEYLAGASTTNTNLRDANPAATRIDLQEVDFDDLKGKADLYEGTPGLDAYIKMYSNGSVYIYQHTAPRIDRVEKTKTYQKYMGKKKVPYTVKQWKKVGREWQDVEETYVKSYKTVYYYVWEDVKVGTKTVTKYKNKKVQTGTKAVQKSKTEKVKVGTKTVTKYKNKTVQTGTKTVTKSKQEPVYKTRTVTKYKSVKVWKPYDTGGAGGGTSVGGGATGALGEWVWENQPYQAEETYIDHYKTITWTEQEPVYKTIKEPYTVNEPIYENKTTTWTEYVPVYKTVKEPYTVNVPVYENKYVKKSKKEPVYGTRTVRKKVDVYDWVEKTKYKKEKVYKTITEKWIEEVYFKPEWMPREKLKLGKDKSGTIYIDGRVTHVSGRLQGRLTIVGNEKVRIDGNVLYVDDKGQTAMANGSNMNKPYARNSKYEGHSVLGIIAREDIVFGHNMPSVAEINGTLMSVNGRVGVDGFWADEDGELHKDSTANRKKYLTEDEYYREKAYDKNGWARTRIYTKESMRRIGGVISNDRIMETFIKQTSDGYATVDAGFKRGNMQFDINLLFNPPPNFVEVPRPVVTAFVPIVLVRNDD